MALLFPWATKEYLLWEMTIGQIVMYHNIGLELKYGGGGGSNGQPTTLKDATYEQAKAARDEARRQLGMTEQDQKEKLRAKYGDIE